MGNTLNKNTEGGTNESQTEINLILNNIGSEVNLILQNQTKNLEKIILHHGQMIRQSLNVQTNYLKTIAENIAKSAQIKLENDIKNPTQKKSIQVDPQSLNLHLQQPPPQKQSFQKTQYLQKKQSPQQEQKNISEQIKYEMVSQMPKLLLQKKTEIYSRIQKIQMNLKKRLYQEKKNNLIIEKSNQLQKINELELSNNIDYKDRFLLIPLIKDEKYSKLDMMNPWISNLYQKLSEEAFYGYLHKHMNKEEMKMFFSKNLILNTVKIIRSLTDQQTSVKQILEKFDKISGPALEFQLKKYPQKRKIFIKSQIQNMVQLCQYDEDPQYDILTNMKFRYQYEKNGIYYKKIKLMINEIIKLSNQHFKQYQEEMKQIFIIQSKKQYIKKQEKIMKQKINTQQNINKQDKIMKEANIKKEQKVNIQQKINKQQIKIPIKYIQYQIGRKINQNTPLFEDYQINSNKIKIQSPQIMRIIIKWIQELEDKIKIQNLQKYIDNRYYPFPLRDGGQVQYSKYQRQIISERFQKYLSQHKQQNNIEILQNIESQMINYIDTNSKNFTYISQNNIQVGLVTHLLSETIQEIAIKRLNQVLHTILSFQKYQERRNYQQEQNFGKVNYITFSVYDLLRSRCTGSYQKIEKVYKQLKESKNFKIIRVKNRLATGNRDFLINMQFKKTPIICELQLGLILETSSVNQKQDRLGDFNHFLYQLKRSKYGPLAQAVLLNAHYSQSITFFQAKLKKFKLKFQKEKNIKIQSLKPEIRNDEIQIPGYEIQQQEIIFVCHNCLQIKYTKTSFLNTYKKMKIQNKYLKQYLCGECVVNSLQISDRNKYLLADYINQYFQQINHDEILKHYQMLNNKQIILKIKQIQILLNDKNQWKNQLILNEQWQKLKKYQKLQYDLSFYLIISANRRRYIVRRIDKDYFIQSFSLVPQKFQFLKINQLDIKYVYRLVKSINNYENIIMIHNIQQLNQRGYINKQKKEFLINNKTSWNQAVCIEGLKGYLLIGATKVQYGGDYKSNLNRFIKTKQIKKFKQSKLEYMDFGYSRLDQKLLQQNLKGIKQIKKLNLSENNLTEINQIIKEKTIVELKLNNNKLQSVIIPIQSLQSLIRLQIRYNQLMDIDVSALLNLQILDISYNQIENIDLDKLVKLKQLKLKSNKIQKLSLTNKQCQKLILSFNKLNKLSKLDISKMEKLKQLYIDRNELEQLLLVNPQLQILDISKNNLKEIDTQKLINLKQLTMYQNKLQNLTLTNPKLQSLNISHNPLTSVNLKALVNLKQLYLSENKLKQLQLDNPLLEILQVMNNNLQKMDISKLINLKRLNAKSNQLTQFTGLGIESLQLLSLGNNKLKKINLNGYTNLRILNIRDNQIDQFIVGNLKIQKINAQKNKIRKVDITKLNKIQRINFNWNKIQQIMLTNKSLQWIDISNNRIYNINVDKLNSLKTLDISNNCITTINIIKQNNPKLQRIQLNNLKSNYEKYFIQKLSTEQQVAQYEQQIKKAKAEDGQIMTKLGFYPIITKETFSKIIQTLNHQYDKKIQIIDQGQKCQIYKLNLIIYFQMIDIQVQFKKQQYLDFMLHRQICNFLQSNVSSLDQ